LAAWFKEGEGLEAEEACMDAYLEKIMDPAVLVTLFIVFILARATAGGRSVNSLSPTPPTQEEIDAALKRVTLSKWMEIDAELDARKKINAIKLLREATGLGLKDSKDAIEAHQKKRGMHR